MWSWYHVMSVRWYDRLFLTDSNRTQTTKFLTHHRHPPQSLKPLQKLRSELAELQIQSTRLKMIVGPRLPKNSAFQFNDCDHDSAKTHPASDVTMMGVCDLWSVAEPSQIKGKEREVWSAGRSMGGSRSQSIVRSVGRQMDRWMDAWMVYLTGKQLSVNAHPKEILLVIPSQ